MFGGEYCTQSVEAEGEESESVLGGEGEERCEGEAFD